MNRNRSFASAIAMLIASVWQSTAADIRLAWDKNSEPHVTSYNLYYGEVGGAPIKLASAQNSTTVRNLIPGKTYSFYVTAVTDGGIESVPSQQVTHTVTATSPL